MERSVAEEEMWYIRFSFGAVVVLRINISQQ
jgi:alpha/beta superfamily hydrolase